MYRIIDKRATGKTKRLMQVAKENNAVFVCLNPNSMRYKAQQYGIDGIEFIDYRTYLTYGNESYGKVVIDELEMFLYQVQCMYCGRGKLIGYTISKDDVNDES